MFYYDDNHKKNNENEFSHGGLPVEVIWTFQTKTIKMYFPTNQFLLNANRQFPAVFQYEGSFLMILRIYSPLLSYLGNSLVRQTVDIDILEMTTMLKEQLDDFFIFAKQMSDSVLLIYFNSLIFISYNFCFANVKKLSSCYFSIVVISRTSMSTVCRTRMLPRVQVRSNM
jgi:hypothetical protein